MRAWNLFMGDEGFTDAVMEELARLVGELRARYPKRWDDEGQLP